MQEIKAPMRTVSREPKSCLRPVRYSVSLDGNAAKTCLIIRSRPFLKTENSWRSWFMTASAGQT